MVKLAVYWIKEEILNIGLISKGVERLKRWQSKELF